MIIYLDTPSLFFKSGTRDTEFLIISARLIICPSPPSEVKMFPNQLIYASSAGRTDQYLFRKYRECSLHMDAGDKRYFCADINADTVIKA